MNRIVIVGNGFDKYNGLDTDYSSFVDWYLEKNITDAFKAVETYDDENLTVPGLFQKRVLHSEIIGGHDAKQIVKLLKKEGKLKTTYDGEAIVLKHGIIRQTLRNIKTYGWADIEHIYYQKILSILEEVVSEEFKIQKIEKLNKSLSEIRKYLILYLRSLKKPNKIAFSNICHESYDDSDYRKKYLDRAYENAFYENDSFLYKKTIFVNFNYTNYWIKSLNSVFDASDRYDVINIHGELEGDQENTPFFGYGDDKDEKYKELEKFTFSDEWSKYFKTVYYQNTDNYKSIIDYTDSDPFQVIIVGHSCGLSDKTLLNKIFEHENCLSIKPFYYKYKIKDEDKDNWHSLMTNISRIFTNKEKMREVVVSKCYRNNEERKLFFDSL